jgi:hypothetical protein
MTHPAPVCLQCVHYYWKDHRHCDAFPVLEIPDEIWKRQNPHTSPIKGDRFIRFKEGIPRGKPWRFSGLKLSSPDGHQAD